MAVISTALVALAEWLGAQSFSPPLREISLGSALPAAAYPRLLIELQEESFAPHESDVTATLRLLLEISDGRPLEAMASARSLAGQLRQALAQSHGLGGQVKSLRVNELTYSNPSARAEEPQLLSSAALTVEIKYSEH
jgi:hypothetical protein